MPPQKKKREQKGDEAPEKNTSKGTPLKGQGTSLKGQGDPGGGRPVGTKRPSSLTEAAPPSSSTKPPSEPPPSPSPSPPPSPTPTPSPSSPPPFGVPPSETGGGGDAFDKAAKTDYYNEPKDEPELLARQRAAASLQKAMAMDEGERKKQAIQKARGQALDAGVSIARVDRFINEPAFAKAETLRRVRAAGKEAADAGKPKDRFTQFVEKYKKENSGKEPSGEEKAAWYGTEAANLRAQGFTGVKGDGGLAELYQMQADRLSGVAPGTYTALSKGAKKIAPDSEIIDSYAQKVAEGRMTPEAARRAFAQDMLDKLRYDDPRRFDRDEAEYQAAVAEAKRTGSPIPERPLPGADIDFAVEARRFPAQSTKPTIIRNSGNYITGVGTKGVYD